MLSKQDLSQMQEYMFQILPQLLHQSPEITKTIEKSMLQLLPQLLRQDPEIATTIEGMLAHQFPRRDEFTQLLNEMKLLREDTNRRFDLLQKEMKQSREDSNRRFEQVEQSMVQLQKEMKQLREDSNRRFEQVERRFDEQRREQLDMKRRLIKVESTMVRLDEKITQFDAWLKVVTGNVGDKKGKEAEQLFALGLSYGLKRSDIKPETIQLRCEFQDEEGIVFPKKGKFIEVDILAENGKLSVFEVKTTAIETDVITFVRKVQLIQHQTPDKQVTGIFISPEASEKVKQCCIEYDVIFVG
jgi:hypothetical protein